VEAHNILKHIYVQTAPGAIRGVRGRVRLLLAERSEQLNNHESADQEPWSLSPNTRPPLSNQLSKIKIK
jgi:hypothetical protein